MAFCLRTRTWLQKMWTALTHTLFFHLPAPNTHNFNFSSFIRSLYLPLKEEQQAEQTIRMIMDIYEQLEDLRAERGLEPAEEVNKLFGKLVGICTEGFRRDFVEAAMDDQRIELILPHLRQMCAEGEGLLEAHSVRTMLGVGYGGLDQESAFRRLQAFSYYQNYIDLTRLELAALYAITSTSSRTIRKIAFIGSGPLPLSLSCLLDVLNRDESPLKAHFEPPNSFLVMDQMEIVVGEAERELVKVMNIDRDEEAMELSKKLCHALGSRARGIQFLHVNIGSTRSGEEEGVENEIKEVEDEKSVSAAWIRCCVPCCFGGREPGEEREDFARGCWEDG